MQGSSEAVTSLQARVVRAMKRSQRMAFGERDYSVAVRVGERLLSTQPDDPEPWILQARALHALKRSDEALKIWRLADTRAPNRVDVFLGIARAAQDIGALDESRAAVTKALSLAPGDVKCQELLAKLDMKAAGARGTPSQ
jgi:cytochrome c-type biogenesis protein CcmH/NrfG